MDKDLMKKAAAEALGTFVLVFFACGTAIISGGDLVATALSFGLVIVAMAYTIGGISGCHINPAVSLAMLYSKKLTKKEFCYYVAAQFIGAIAGAFLLYFIIKMGFGGKGLPGYATNNVPFNADHEAYGYVAAFLFEIVLTFLFVFVILTVVSKPELSKKAGLIIGLTLTLVHLIGINFTGTSVNPARSFGPALCSLIFCDVSAINEATWKAILIFLTAPFAGGLLAAVVHKCFFKGDENKNAEGSANAGSPQSKSNEVK